MKYNGPKARRCRRHSMNLYGSQKYDKVMQRKPYPPGKGPKSQITRPSEFANQLREKQKARDMFGLTEKQFANLYTRASSMPGQTGDILKRFLEERLDNVVYRSGFAMTRLQSRQFVGHGLFLVDGKRVKSPSFRVKVGNVLTVRPQAKSSPMFVSILAAHEKYMPPSWIKVEPAALRAEIVGAPELKDTEQALDMRQIVEFYSRN